MSCLSSLEKIRSVTILRQWPRTRRQQLKLRRTVNHSILFSLALVLLCSVSPAQPMASSKQEIGSLSIYKDFKDPKLFYYAPGSLKSAYEKDGTPKFQLLEMRYTG